MGLELGGGVGAIRSSGLGLRRWEGLCPSRSPGYLNKKNDRARARRYIYRRGTAGDGDDRREKGGRGAMLRGSFWNRGREGLFGCECLGAYCADA